MRVFGGGASCAMAWSAMSRYAPSMGRHIGSKFLNVSFSSWSVVKSTTYPNTLTSKLPETSSDANATLEMGMNHEPIAMMIAAAPPRIR